MSFAPSQIAAAAVTAARASLGVAPAWSVSLQAASGINYSHVSGCVQAMLKCVGCGFA